MLTYHKISLKQIILLGFIGLFLFPTSGMAYDFSKECPENSVCDQKFLKRYNHWKSFINSLGTGPASYQKIESYRSKFGIPIYFRVASNKDTSLSGAYWRNECNKGDRKIHHQVLALQFFKKAPSGDVAKFDTYKIGKSIYKLPTNSRPYAVNKGKIISHFDIEGRIVLGSTSNDGDWKIRRPNKKIRDLADKHFSWNSCKPESMKFAKCFQVWNNDSKKVIQLKLESDCL